MNKQIRVLQMIPSFYYGGSQAMIVNLYKAVDREKVQFDFIVDHTEYEGLKETVESLGARTYSVPSFNGLNIKQIRNAWDELLTNHPEYKILHCHCRKYSSLFLPVVKKHGLKVIVHSHNTSNGNGFKSFVKNTLKYPLRKQADYFFACSKEAGQWLFGENIVNNKNFYIINNSIDTDKFVFDKEIRKKYRKEFMIKDEKVFLQVGRFTEQKNYLFTLELFSEYIKKDEKTKLVLVGDGELKKDIENKINELSISDNVILLSYRNDVNCLLQMSDYFLMPSLWEGLSVAAIEAEASDIKCLMSDKVDKNVNITNKCVFIPLEINEWLKYMDDLIKERKNNKSLIVKAGFDVKENSKWIQDFYLNIVK